MRLIELAISVSKLSVCWTQLPNLLLCSVLMNSGLICDILCVVYCSNLELATASRRLGSLKHCITIVAGDPVLNRVLRRLRLCLCVVYPWFQSGVFSSAGKPDPAGPMANGDIASIHQRIGVMGVVTETNTECEYESFYSHIWTGFNCLRDWIRWEEMTRMSVLCGRFEAAAEMGPRLLQVSSCLAQQMLLIMVPGGTSCWYLMLM